MMSSQASGHEESGGLSVETFLACFLFLLAAWTVFIKYLFPVAYSLAAGEPLTAYVYWDLWPVAHAWLGWALLARPPWTRALAIGMAVVEIGIVLFKLSAFLAEPEWTIWRSNWFVNKVFVLLCFALVLVAALVRGERWRPVKVEQASNGGP